VPGDVSSLADPDRLLATVKRQQGHLDVLFANADERQIRVFWRQWQKLKSA
jgi:hypothetical protein